MGQAHRRARPRRRNRRGPTPPPVHWLDGLGPARAPVHREILTALGLVAPTLTRMAVDLLVRGGTALLAALVCLVFATLAVLSVAAGAFGLLTP